MRTMLAGALVALFLAACAGGAVPGVGMLDATTPSIPNALADERRPEADTARDSLRHPAEVLAFMQVRAGQRVADVGPGAGYYTRLLAVTVGEGGRVYAVDRPGTPERPRPMAAVTPDYSNITHLQAGYQGWSAGEPLDAILIVQIYHDFHLPQLNLDVAQINRDMFAALKPGGVLVVADHAAAAGSPANVMETLHRIEQSRVRSELEAAGFVFEAESQVLRNPNDDHALRVFEGDIRGRTDQFLLRFRKPAA